MLLLIIIIAGLTLWVAYNWVRFIWSLLKALFVSIKLLFSNEKQVDEAYIKHVLSKDPEYKKFQQNIKSSI